MDPRVAAECFIRSEPVELPDNSGTNLPSLFALPTGQLDSIALGDSKSASVKEGGQKNYGFLASPRATYTAIVSPSDGVAYLRVFLGKEQIASALERGDNAAHFNTEEAGCFVLSIRGNTDARFSVRIVEGFVEVREPEPPPDSVSFSSRSVSVGATRGGRLPESFVVSVKHTGGTLRVVPETLPDWLNATVRATQDALVDELEISVLAVDHEKGDWVTAELVRDGAVVAKDRIYVSLNLEWPIVISAPDSKRSSGYSLATSYEVASFAGSTTTAVAVFRLNTGTTSSEFKDQGNRINWTVASDKPWVAAEPICACDVEDSTLDQFRLTFAGFESLTPGVHTANIIVSDQYGHAVPFSAILNLSPNRISVPRGVAFAQVGVESSLVRTLSIGNSSQIAMSWTANTNTNWIQIAKNADELTLTADPSGLQKEVLHYGTVVVSSPSAAQDELVNVGLYISDAGVSTSTQTIVRYDTSTANHGEQDMVTDPIRPHLYLHRRGPEVLVFNIYTGHQIAKYNIGAKLERDFQVGHLEVSMDGKTLYVTEFRKPRLVMVSLPDGAVSELYNLSIPEGADFVMSPCHTIVDGREVLVGNIYDNRSLGLGIYDGTTAERILLWEKNHATNVVGVDCRPSTPSVLFAERGYSNQIERYELRYYSGSELVQVERTHRGFHGATVRDAYVPSILDVAGTGFYTVANKTSILHIGASKQTIVDFVDKEVHQLAVGPFESKLYAFVRHDENLRSLWVYDSFARKMVTSAAFAAETPHVITQLSSDGLRIVARGRVPAFPTWETSKEVVWTMKTRF